MNPRAANFNQRTEDTASTLTAPELFEEKPPASSAEQESTLRCAFSIRLADRLGVDVTEEADPSLAEETDLEHLATAMDDTLPDAPGTAGLQPPAFART